MNSNSGMRSLSLSEVVSRHLQFIQNGEPSNLLGHSLQTVCDDRLLLLPTNRTENPATSEKQTEHESDRIKNQSITIDTNRKPIQRLTKNRSPPKIALDDREASSSSSSSDQHEIWPNRKKEVKVRRRTAELDDECTQETQSIQGQSIIDLSKYNDIQPIQKKIESMPSSSSAQILLLSHNNLSQYLSKSSSSLFWGSLVSHLPFIQHLDISYNELRSIPPGIQKFPHLTLLNLSHNQLPSPLSLLFTSFTFPKLQTLLLHSNPMLNEIGDINIDDIQFLCRIMPQLKQIQGGFSHTIPNGSFSQCRNFVENNGENVKESNETRRFSSNNCNPRFLSRVCCNRTEIHPSHSTCSITDTTQSVLSFVDIQSISDKNEDLIQKLSEKDMQLRTATQESYCLNHELKNSRMELKSEKVVATQLRSRLEALEEIQEQTQNKLLISEKKSNLAATETSNIRNENTELKGRLHATQKDASDEINQLREDIEGIENEVKRLATSEYNKHCNLMTESQKTIQTMQRQMTEMEASHTKQLRSIEGTCKDQAETIREITTKSKHLQEMNDRLRQREADHSAIVKSLSKRAEAAEEKILSAENGRKEAIENKQYAETKATRLEEELAGVRNELTELSSNWVGRKQYEEKIAMTEDLEAKATAQKERITKLTERNETMRLELEQLKSSLLIAEKLSNENDLQLRIQTQQMEDVKRQLETTNGKLSASQRNLEDSEKKVRKLGAELETLTTLKTKLEAELKKFADSEVLLKEKKNLLEAEQKIEAMEREKKRKDEAFLYLQDAINSLEKDMRLQKTTEARRLRDFEDAQKLLAEKLSDSEAVIEKLKHQSEELEKVLMQRDEEIRALLGEIEQLECKNKEKMQKVEQFFKSIA